MAEVRVENFAQLRAKLKKLTMKYGNTIESVTVGFTQRYALWVHEVQANHVVGQWKYLETPARAMKREMARLIETAAMRGVPMLQCLMIAGLRLQREAQKLTPVDTSALKASAFTCPTADVEAISKAAYQTSEAQRLGEVKKRHQKTLVIPKKGKRKP